MVSIKYTLVGLSNRIATHLNNIKAWSASFRQCCSYGEIVLLCANATHQELEECAKLGICAIPVCVKNEQTIYHQRLSLLKEYMDQQKDGEVFLVTDVFDVVFQMDPFAMCDFSTFNLFAGEEGVDVDQEPWNAANIRALFPNDLDMCLHHPVVCSGVIAGRKDALSHLYGEMYEMCEYGSTGAHKIRDQAALIVLMSQSKVKGMRIFRLDDGWAVHCAVSGPTEFFEKWNFKNKLLKKGMPIPYMENGVIKNCGNPFAIVHQYNRVPEWNSLIVEKYR